MKIEYSQLNNIATNLDNNRSPYYALWQWATLFSGSLNNLKQTPGLGDNFTGSESIPADTKSALDPSTINLFDTAAQYYSGIFFPENNPFLAKSNEEEPDEKTTELFERINHEMNRQMKLKETNFQDSKERSYYDYVILGTKALMALPNPDDDFAFWVSNYSTQNMAFNPNRDIFLLGYQWTADVIVAQLAGDDEKAYAKLPEKVRNSYQTYDFSSQFNVKCLMMKNRDYTKGAMGANGMQYMGFWLIDGTNEIVKTDYHKERPIAESLYKVRTGEIYGRSPLTDRKSGFEIYDGVLYMITNNIAKIGDPATGYFDAGSIGFDYDTTPGSMQAFNMGLLGGQAPTFKIQDAGDITPAVSYLQPKLYEALRTAYGVDAMVDLMAQKRQMTATEVMTIENLRNKILAPRIRREVSELLPFKRRLFLLTARWMYRHDKISDSELDLIEQLNWDISENSSVERIIQSENMTQFQTELNIVAASQAVSPKLSAAVDLYDATNKVLENGFIKLLPKKDYNNKVKQQENLAILSQLPQTPTTEQPQEE